MGEILDTKMNFLDLFSGIGGFALGAYWAGLRFENHYYSEIDPYTVKVYQQRFPDSIGLGDIKNVKVSDLPSGDWIMAGGFPCQPHSMSGERRAENDERDLWPQCARMLRELRPRFAVFENVPGLLTSSGGRFFNRVLSDISESGYACEWKIISAASLGAPHQRDRIYIVAYPDGTQFQGGGISCGGQEKYSDSSVEGWWKTEPRLDRMANGLPNQMERLHAIGNAIVPEIAEMIFRRIRELIRGRMYA